jgi:hypothetical protein
VQVLSDIDDTLVCPNSQGRTDLHFYAGVDKHLEAKELYPSVEYVPARPIMLSSRPQKASVFPMSQGSELNLYMGEVGDRDSQSSWGVPSASSMNVTLLD